MDSWMQTLRKGFGAQCHIQELTTYVKWLDLSKTRHNMLPPKFTSRPSHHTLCRHPTSHRIEFRSRWNVWHERMWRWSILLVPVLIAILWKSLFLTTTDCSYFVGDYTLYSPGFFIFADNNLNHLQFSLSTQCVTTFPSNLQQSLNDYHIETRVSLENINEELGPILRIRWTWKNDASTELYEIGFIREGPGLDDHDKPKSNRQLALIYAFKTTNDGDPWSGPDQLATLLSFVPG